MNTQFVPVHPKKLRQVWDFVRQGLQVVLKKAPDKWIPEDVYAAVKAGDAQLFLINPGGDQFCGFLVVEKCNERFTDEPYLHVWVAYSFGGKRVYADGVRFLKQFAQQAQCARITFSSNRGGWTKRFRQVETIYEV